ncbi:unnamed protein product, partial [Ectocarpus sp. 4 AP-2014]
QGLACSGEGRRSRFSRLWRDSVLACSWSPSNPPGQHADTPRPSPRPLVVGQKARGALVWGWFCWAFARCVCWGFSATRSSGSFHHHAGVSAGGLGRGAAVEQYTIEEGEGVAEKWLKPGPPAP